MLPQNESPPALRVALRRFFARFSPRTLDVVIPVAVAFVVVMSSFAFRAPCVRKLGNLEFSERHLCYTDIYALYGVEELSKGSVPYFDQRQDGKYVEYPVVIGGWMFVTSRLTYGLVGEADRATVRGYNTYFWLNQLGFGLLILVTAAALGALAGWKRALLFAAAPTLLLHGGVSWDILAVAPFVLAILAFTRARDGTAGVLLGIGAAAKLFPIFAVPYLLIQRIREGKWRQGALLTASSVLTLVLINLPVAIGAPQGWKQFFRLNRERGADWDSIWYHISQTWHVTFETPKLNLITAVLFILGGLAFAAWTWFRLRRDETEALPGLKQATAIAMLLVVFWFLIVNKVWSPQYGLWLLPFWSFAVPLDGWRLVAAWTAFQGLETWVFVTRFWMFAGKATYSAFRAAIFARLATAIVLISWLLGRRAGARAEPAPE